MGEVQAGGRVLALVNCAGEVRAFEGTCPHLSGPVGQGNFVDGHIICPWHAWEFDAASGECVHEDGVALRRYEVEVRGGEIWVEID